MKLEENKNNAIAFYIRRFSHDNFTDLKYVMEGDKNAIELQRALIKTFFDKYVKGISVDIESLEEGYDELSISIN